MLTSSSKAKGRKLQQQVRDWILDNSQDLTLDDVKSTSMGAQGEDVQLSSAARRQWPFSFECKSLASFAFYKYLQQATANAPTGTTPVLVCKANNKKPVVIVDAEWFFNNWRKDV